MLKKKWAQAAHLPQSPQSVAGMTEDAAVKIARDLIPTVKSRRDLGDQKRCTPDETLVDLHNSGLIRILQPAGYGGADLDLHVLVKICLEIAKGCPSTSWNLANFASHHWMLGHFSKEAQDEIWGQAPDTLIATSLSFPSGNATIVDGGYNVSGKWPYSSGLDGCDWTIVAATVRNAAGAEVDQRFMLLHKSEYKNHGNWNTVGLAGTGSHDLSCKDVFVPAYRTLQVDGFYGAGSSPGSQVNRTPLFQAPLMALFPYVILGIPLGCAAASIDLFVGEARQRECTQSFSTMRSFQTVQVKLAEASALVDAATLIALENCKHAFDLTRKGATVTLNDKLKYRRDAAFATRMCVEAVDLLMLMSGGAGIGTRNELQKNFYDIHASSAHFIFNFDAACTNYGQAVLGITNSKLRL